MVRRAFVMGSNGPESFGKLNYAVTDAEKTARCLSNELCGFKVIEPNTDDTVNQVRDKLLSTTIACTKEDTLLFYFSGHGVLVGGELYLIWDNKENDVIEMIGLPTEDIKNTIKRCKAKNKLLILDCCHAGAAGMKDGLGTPVENLNLLPERMNTLLITQDNEFHINPSSFLILMASDRLERAREVEELKGGFLTTKLCEALSSHFVLADKDEDNKISIMDLKKWLEEATEQYNSECKKQNKLNQQVPCPIIYGQQKGDFFLTLPISINNQPNTLLTKSLKTFITNLKDTFPEDIKSEVLKETEEYIKNSALSKSTAKTIRIQLLEQLLQHSITMQQFTNNWKLSTLVPTNQDINEEPTKVTPTQNDGEPTPTKKQQPASQQNVGENLSNQTIETKRTEETAKLVTHSTKHNLHELLINKKYLGIQRTILFISAVAIFTIAKISIDLLRYQTNLELNWWSYTSGTFAVLTLLITQYTFTKITRTKNIETKEQEILAGSFDILLVSSFLILFTFTPLIQLLPNTLIHTTSSQNAPLAFFFPITLYSIAHNVINYRKAENQKYKPTILIISSIMSLTQSTTTLIWINLYYSN